MTGVKFHGALLLMVLMLGGCHIGVDAGFDCSDLDKATTSFERMLGEISIELEKDGSGDERLSRVERYIREHKRTVDACSARVNESFRSMDVEAMMKHHETYVQSPPVKRFLDVQDRFQETATQDQVERLDEMLAFFNLLFE